MATAQSIITGAYKDIGGLRPGMGMSTDVLNESLETLNEMISYWAMGRLFIYEFITSAWVILPSFSDLTTNHVLAKGNELALRKNVAVRMAPALKIYLKTPEPLLQEVAAEAAESKQMIDGVGPS